MNNIKPLFIVFEGPDGSGKSTIAKLFSDYLKTNNIESVLTHEPGENGLKFNEVISKILLDKNDLKICPKTEALLFATSRSQHIFELIKPSLENNKIVICDRFLHSSLAYQGWVRGLGIEEVYKINEFAINDCKPDIVFYFDIDPQLARKRINDNNRKVNKLDDEKEILQSKVIEGYKKSFALYPNFNFEIIDASKDIDNVLNQVIIAFNKYYNI